VPEPEELAEIARRIAAETDGFTGGNIEHFGEVGFDALKENGLNPRHRVLDLGCGTSRLGYWLVRYLDPDRYYGIEPIKKYVDAGLAHALGPEFLLQKRPRFRPNRNFDFSVFGVTFDYVVARSIFSHAAPDIVAAAIDSFRANSKDDAVMLMSYRQLKDSSKGGHVCRDVDDLGWGFHKYALEYLQNMARDRGMFAGNFGEPFNDQIWLRLSRRA